MWLIRKTTYFKGRLDSISFYKRGGWENVSYTAEPGDAPNFERKAEAIQKMNELRKFDNNVIKISTYAVVSAFAPMSAAREESSAGAALLR